MLCRLTHPLVCAVILYRDETQEPMCSSGIVYKSSSCSTRTNVVTVNVCHDVPKVDSINNEKTFGKV